MSAPHPESTPVPNPALQWLRDLLRDVEGAQQAIPSLEHPTSIIGPGPAWTGTQADRVHDHQLAPHVRPFDQALRELSQQVQDEINRTAPTVPAGTAKLMRIDYYGR